METTDYYKIFWHDTRVHRIIETCNSDQMIFEVDYPQHWENNVYIRTNIVFDDCVIDSVQTTWTSPQPPMLNFGFPAILGADIMDERGEFKLIRLETTHWTRTFWCTKVTLMCRDDNPPRSND